MTSMRWTSMSVNLPTPCKRRLISLVKDWFQMFVYLGWLRSWQYSRSLPVTSSRTVMAQRDIRSQG